MDSTCFLRDSAHSSYWGDFSIAQVSPAFPRVPCLTGVPRPGRLSPGKTNLAHVAKPFSWNDLIAPNSNSNCSSTMFRAFPETKGHCHSQGLVQCTPQKEGRKVNIENWGDIQRCKTQQKENCQEITLQWGQIQTPWSIILIQATPSTSSRTVSAQHPSKWGQHSQKLVRTFPLSSRARLLF